MISFIQKKKINFFCQLFLEMIGKIGHVGVKNLVAILGKIDEEMHYYYDPKDPVITNQEIYSDTDEDTETDDRIIDEWEPTSQQTIEEAKRLSLERCHPKGACQACGFMGFAGRTLHECIAENVRNDQGDIIAYLNNETWWEERP